MKILYIGCVELSYSILMSLESIFNVEIVGIVTKEHSQFNSDFQSLVPYAVKKNIPYLIFKNNDQLEEWLMHIKYDIIYCFGWSHLLPLNIIKTAKLGAIGYHPALLPENRGRHPIIWSLVLGLEETGSTFFFLDEGADSGDIVSQVRIKIDKQDAARDLYNKLTKAAQQQVVQFTKEIIQGSLIAFPQNNEKANYWRKRTKQDGLIDWRMSSISIFNLVRALSEPYDGAHCFYKGREIKILKVSVEESYKYCVRSNIEPGKVLKTNVNDNSFLVKSGDGAVNVLHHTFEHLPNEGEYLL